MSENLIFLLSIKPLTHLDIVRLHRLSFFHSFIHSHWICRWTNKLNIAYEWQNDDTTINKNNNQMLFALFNWYYTRFHFVVTFCRIVGTNDDARMRNAPTHNCFDVLSTHPTIFIVQIQQTMPTILFWCFFFYLITQTHTDRYVDRK